MTTKPEIKECDVFIAGSGPIGGAFAREILKAHPTATVWIADIGSQDSPVIGAHHKNSIKYQKDIDSFVHVINGALQPISVPPASTFMPTLGEVAWTPDPDSEKPHLIQSYHNPNQKPHLNLTSFVTRTVGGMATHWTCACPFPHPDEKKDSPIPSADFDKLLKEAHDVLGVNLNEFDISIRHRLVKEALTKHYGEARVKNLPLAVKRNANNSDYVTWSGVDTVLGDAVKKPGFKLITETRVTKFLFDPTSQGKRTIEYVEVRDLKSNVDYWIKAKQFVVACGAVSTPQILWNSHIRPPALGHYLAEQSLTFCQIVLKRSLIDSIPERFPGEYKKHADKNPTDPMPIPFADPEPQVTLPYSTSDPWHVQIHRDAFAYGGVGPRADPRVVVDLRFFGRQEIKYENCVTFPGFGPMEISPDTDGYGMPQATFHVKRSATDAERDHRMMGEMCTAANVLGAYLPGSEPQFMEPGLVLHITGTTRLGTKESESVADANSKVHNYTNLFVGGNGVIPDSTACNPTLTSVAYALQAARHLSANFTPSQ